MDNTNRDIPSSTNTEVKDTNTEVILDSNGKKQDIPTSRYKPVEETIDYRIMDRPKVTLKQEKFVEAYVGEANGNATQAARVAGYSQSSDITTRSIACETLTNPNVQKLVEIRRKEIMYRLQAKSHDAVTAMFDIIDDDSTPPQTRLAAIRDLLDRIGTAPTQKTEVSGNLTHTAAVHERARQILAERQQNSKEELPEQPIVDVEAITDDVSEGEDAQPNTEEM